MHWEIVGSPVDSVLWPVCDHNRFTHKLKELTPQFGSSHAGLNALSCCLPGGYFAVANDLVEE